MRPDKSISAVVISFNGIEFIAACLDTLKADLAGYDHEIIVVDNGSTDGTVAFIETNHPNIQLIKNGRNRGFAQAINQGIKASGKNFIWLLNQDIHIRPGCLAALFRCYDQLSNIGMIGPRFVGFDGRLQRSCRRFPCYHHVFAEIFGLARLFPRSRIFNGWKMGDFDHLTSCKADQPMGAAMLIERDRIARIGGLDESFGIFFNDVDFCLRLKEAGYVNYYCAEAVIEHFVGGSVSRAKPKMVWLAHLSMFRYFLKQERRRPNGLIKAARLPLPYITGVFLIAAALPRSAYHLIRKVI